MSRHHGDRPKHDQKVLAWRGAGRTGRRGAVTAMNVSSTGAVADASTVNLVADPTLSKGVATWFTRSGGSLAVVAGHNGHRAIRLRNETAAPLTLALNDRVNTVHATVAGATYQASAWIRTDAPGVTAAVRQMEYQRLVLRGTKLTSAWLRTTGWVHVSANYTAAASLSTIDFNVLAWALPRGRSLLVSEPSLILLSLPSQPVPVGHPVAPGPTTPPAAEAHHQRPHQLGTGSDLLGPGSAPSSSTPAPAPSHLDPAPAAAELLDPGPDPAPPPTDLGSGPERLQAGLRRRLQHHRPHQVERPQQLLGQQRGVDRHLPAGQRLRQQRRADPAGDQGDLHRRQHHQAVHLRLPRHHRPRVLAVRPHRDARQAAHRTGHVAGLLAARQHQPR